MTVKPHNRGNTTRVTREIAPSALNAATQVEVDAFGNKVSMTTYRDISLAQGDTTRWRCDEASGSMTNKVYADGKGPTYSYTSDGKLARHTWARGVETFYTYDGWGSLTNTVYSDSTPAVSLAYDAMGRQIEAHDAAGVTTFAYDDFGSLTNETVIGVAGTNTIERFSDEFGRDAGYALNGVRQTTLAYDPATGRLATMQISSQEGSDIHSPPPPLFSTFQWAYHLGSDLKQSLTYPNGLTASWEYDANNQLLQVSNATASNVISRYAYTYDAAGRRISCAHSGSAFDRSDTIDYGYNVRSELTNATAAVDSDYRYGYDFDDIGNRRRGLERRVQSAEYTANNLNQYTEISNSTVQPSTSDFQPQYDADGNQTLVKTATGIWQITYNGENRPVQWTQGDTVINMSFDRMGRRVTKNDQRFVYDGFLQIANFHSSTSTSHFNYYLWDPTEPVATRPLAWSHSTPQLSTPQLFFYTHDSNKNVSEVIASDNDIVAHYEYAPFGALIASGGASAAVNPWRFSSEFAEDDTATVYYNYRHYEPLTGRWMTRDRCMLTPLNPYLLLANRTFGVDCLGKYDEWVHYYLMYYLILKCGFDKDTAKIVAEGSQYPDGENIWQSLFSVSFDAMNLMVIFTRKYQETLHNLNGLEYGKLKEYQCCIRDQIQKILNGKVVQEMEYFKVGVLFHALGDTYAHFKLVIGADGNSYSEFIGHFFDGTRPDDPHYNMERFRQYLEDLERLISRNRNYALADSVYEYMSNPAVKWFDPKTGRSYKGGKKDSYQDQIKQLYSARYLRFEIMSVNRTNERKEAVKDLVKILQECLEKARK